MNYYIQGDTANADRIKAAFERLGYKNRCNYTFTSRGNIYFTISKDNDLYALGIDFIELFRNNPDYQELELPVEPKFKVGDWVVRKDGETFYGGNYAEQITLIEVDEKGKCIWLSSTSWVNDDAIRLWSITDAKDGDVLVSTKIRSCPFIYRKTCYDDGYAYYYVGIDGGGDLSIACPRKIPELYMGLIEDAIPATKEQRDLLFAKLREAGCEWDADKKELHKIQHYDIANFHAGMPVLVRDNNKEWRYVPFSHITNGSWAFNAGGTVWEQCVPYAGNEHLLGTTDMPSEEYINW